MNGGLRLACSAERMIELKRQATTARSFGLEMHLLSPEEAQDLWPPMDVGRRGRRRVPADRRPGQSRPTSPRRSPKAPVRRACASSSTARSPAFAIAAGRVAGVVTEQGEIACEVVALCAGQWSRALGRLAGVRVPLVSVQHQYMITERIAGVAPDLPTLRDPDRLIYFKEEVGGLVMGGYEPDPLPWAEAGIPDGFHFTLLDPDWDHFEQFMAPRSRASRRSPRPASSS